MKNIIRNILMVSILLLWGTSCKDFLDVVPDNVATIDIAFNSRVNAEKYLYSIYSYMPNHSRIENPGLISGDEIWVNEYASRNWEGLNIARGDQGVTNPYLDYWGKYDMFIALRDCNIFFDNIDNAKDLEPYERDRWIAEVKFLKAYYHFWLMRMYGAIPIIDKNIPVGSSVEDVRVPREPVDKVVDYIVQLLDEAIPNLPAFIQNEAQDLGRATQPMAAAIKAKVLVTAASPMFNGNTNYPGFVSPSGEEYINSTFDAKKWERAEVACAEAIDLAHAAGNSLYKFPGSAVFELSDTTILKMSIRGAVSEKWNEEIIWGSSNSTAAWIQDRCLPRLSGNVRAEIDERTRKYWAPTLRMAELYYSENGVPIEDDKNYNYAARYEITQAPEDHRYYIEPGYTTVNLHLHREPRFYASLAFDGNIFYGHGRLDDSTNPWVVQVKDGDIGRRVSNYAWSVTGYWPKKLTNMMDVLGSGWTKEVYPWPVFRLADLYLLYAEALNEAKGPSDSYPWIDKVRERAGLKGVLESWNASAKNPAEATTKEGMRDIIRHERMIELAFEGQRFWDLRRWLIAEDYMNKDIRGWDVDEKTSELYLRVQTIHEMSFNLRDYFWPIDEDDLIVNPNLDQNPGW